MFAQWQRALTALSQNADAAALLDAFPALRRNTADDALEDVLDDALAAVPALAYVCCVDMPVETTTGRDGDAPRATSRGGAAALRRDLPRRPERRYRMLFFPPGTRLQIAPRRLGRCFDPRKAAPPADVRDAGLRILANAARFRMEYRWATTALVCACAFAYRRPSLASLYPSRGRRQRSNAATTIENGLRRRDAAATPPRFVVSPSSVAALQVRRPLARAVARRRGRVRAARV